MTDRKNYRLCSHKFTLPHPVLPERGSDDDDIVHCRAPRTLGPDSALNVSAIQPQIEYALTLFWGRPGDYLEESGTTYLEGAGTTSLGLLVVAGELKQVVSTLCAKLGTTIL